MTALVLLSTTQCKVWRQSVSTSNWLLMGGESNKGHTVKLFEDGKVTLHCEFTKSCYFLSQLNREELAALSRECVYLGDEFGKIGWKTPNYNFKKIQGQCNVSYLSLMTQNYIIKLYCCLLAIKRG